MTKMHCVALPLLVVAVFAVLGILIMRASSPLLRQRSHQIATPPSSIECGGRGELLGCFALLPMGNAPIYVPRAQSNFGAYNPSVATVRGGGSSVAVMAVRVSPYTSCAGATPIDVKTVMEESYTVVSIGGSPWRLELPPAWSESLWPSTPPVGGPSSIEGIDPRFLHWSAVRGSIGIQDARPFELSSDNGGMFGLACTVVLSSDSGLPRMALVTALLPSFSAEDRETRVLAPVALVLLANNVDELRRPQKNWMPKIYAQHLYFVQHVSPQTVGRVPLEAVTGARGVLYLQVSEVLREDVRATFIAGIDLLGPLEGSPFGGHRPWRGSSQLIDYGATADDEMVGLVHKRTRGASPQYDHAFVTFSRAPPFALRRMSRPFRFETHLPDTFTFISGLTQSSESLDSYVVTFGVDDCSSQYAVFHHDVVEVLLERRAPNSPPGAVVFVALSGGNQAVLLRS